MFACARCAHRSLREHKRVYTLVMGRACALERGIFAWVDPRERKGKWCCYIYVRYRPRVR